MVKATHRIVPHLWYDKEAVEATAFYATVFPDSRVTHVTKLRDTPSGDCDLVSFEIWGQPFMAISAGPYFKLNPAVSFIVNFDPSREANAAGLIDEIWSKLSDGGNALMPLDEYPFSKRYGWIQDRYGVSWQLMLTNPEGEERPPIVPSLMFIGDQYGKAGEAIEFYVSVFKDSRQGHIVRYPPGMEPDQSGTVMFGDFRLENLWFAAMDSAYEHQFSINEAVSFMINCDSQELIDYYWEKLSAVPEAEQCGWVKDKFGVSWQINSTEMQEMLAQGTPEQRARVTKSFLTMKKFDVAELRRAYNGE